MDLQEEIKKMVGSASKTLFAFCFSFILGVGLFSLNESPTTPTPLLGQDGKPLFFYLYILFIGAMLAAIFFWKNKKWRFIFIVMALFFGGGLRFLSAASVGGAGHISSYNGETINLTGWISSEPLAKTNEATYVVSARTCAPLAACAKNISGKVLVKLPLYPQYNFGDTLEIKCRLQSPQNSLNSEFNYKNYLAKDRIWSICALPKIISVAAPVNSWIKFAKQIYNLKIFFQNQINRLWPEPQSSLLAGLLYGSRTGLTPELTENFNRTGLSHIVAISGFNISIIATYLMFILIYAGLYRQRAFWAVVGGVIFFVIFTGASASVVRAGIMGIVVLMARQVGRLTRSGNVLVFTAAVMAAINPYVLAWDAGFQLSFAAAMGLIYLSPVLEKIDIPVAPALKSVGKALPLFLRRGWGEVIWPIFISTFSAIIATLPLTLWQFGRFSAVAPLTNLLVLWTIPGLMLLGAVALTASFIFYPFGQALAWVAGVGLSYVIMVADWFGRRSWSAMEFKIPWWLMGMMYFVIYVIARRTSSNSHRSTIVIARSEATKQSPGLKK